MATNKPTKIPMLGYPYRNVAEAEQNNLPAVMYDMYCDETGASLKRPGLELFATISSGVTCQGLFYWEEKDIMVSINNGRIYLITISGVVTDITGDALENVNNPATFASYGTGFVIASGGKMVIYDGTNPTSYIVGSGETPADIVLVDHVVGSLVYHQAADPAIIYTFRCIKNHTSDGGNEPFSGVYSPNYWTLVSTVQDPSAVAWVVSTAYTGHNSGSEYTCIKDNIATAETKPGYGVNWTEYWKPTTTGTATLDWTADQSYTKGNINEPPLLVSHVSYLDTYMIANLVGTNRVYWSNGGDPTTWMGLLNSFAAEAKPNNVTAMAITEQTILLVKRDSVEFWYDSGDYTQLFQRQPGASGCLGSGAIAPYSLIFADNFWYWLDTKKTFVVLNGRTTQTVSLPVQKVFDTLSTVSDARSMYLSFAGRSFIALTFPTEGRTFLYDIDARGWCEWSYWNVSEVSREAFLCNSSCISLSTGGDTYVGSRVDGKIYKLTRDVYTDDSNPIRSEKQSGHIDYGSSVNKEHIKLMVRLKRGNDLTNYPSADDKEPVFTYSFSSNGIKSWSNERAIGLGGTGDTALYKELTRLGKDKSRQHRIIHSDNSDFILADIEELVIALRY